MGILVKLRIKKGQGIVCMICGEYCEKLPYDDLVRQQTVPLCHAFLVIWRKRIVPRFAALRVLPVFPACRRYPRIRSVSHKAAIRTANPLVT